MTPEVQPIRCPKCRSLNIILREFITCTGEWSPGDTKANMETGEYFKVVGECFDCHKRWRLRKYIQVWEELRDRLNETGRLLKLQGKSP